MRQLITPALVLLTAACAGPGYYFQAASGHLELMRGRQDVTRVLADPATDPERRAQLRLAADILAFAESRLGLPAGGSYQSLVETGREAVAWNVVAAPEFSLEPRRWCFPVAGCVAYRAYFNREKALSEAARLSERGWDVAVAPVQAYSTLGWFSDPLLDSMLTLPPARLAGVLIHELAHQRLYLRSDMEFSEGYASFVERAGVHAWLREVGLEGELRRWEALLQATQGVNQLLLEARRELSAIYASDRGPDEKRAAKRALLGDLQPRYLRLREQRFPGEDYFSGWFDRPRNNADLALVNAYAAGQCAFLALLREAQGDFFRISPPRRGQGRARRRRPRRVAGAGL